jgi:hypothetical protein
MSSPEDRPTSRRPQEYGVPGPTQGQPPHDGYGVQPPHAGDTYGSPAQGGGFNNTPDQGDPFGRPAQGDPFGQPNSGSGYGQPAPDSGFNSPGPDPYQGPTPYAPLPSGGAGSTAPTKRRGVVPLVIGLILMVVIAPVLTIGGIGLGVGSAAKSIVSPERFDSDSTDVSMSSWQMVVVYVPEEDASSTTCSATAENSEDVTTMPATDETTDFGDNTYSDALTVMTTNDANVTITCDGTDNALYSGPMSLTKLLGPTIIGPILGFVAGLVGLILTIVGIVKLVRSRRR